MWRHLVSLGGYLEFRKRLKEQFPLQTRSQKVSSRAEKCTWGIACGLMSDNESDRSYAMGLTKDRVALDKPHIQHDWLYPGMPFDLNVASNTNQDLSEIWGKKHRAVLARRLTAEQRDPTIRARLESTCPGERWHAFDQVLKGVKRRGRPKRVDSSVDHTQSDLGQPSVQRDPITNLSSPSSSTSADETEAATRMEE